MSVKKFDQIDGLRFFAVLGVICAHWASSQSEFCDSINAASRGVDLFFVISGFLITLGLIRAKEKDAAGPPLPLSEGEGRSYPPLVRRGGGAEDHPKHWISLKNFYIRRFLRIFPIYYLTLFILLFLDVAFSLYGHELVHSIWWYLLYVKNFHSIRIHDWGVVAGHFWSLSVEEQFYMVWPFVILFVPKKRLMAVIIASILISLAVKSYWYFSHAPWWLLYMHPVSALDTLALGALLAYLYTYHQDGLRRIMYHPVFILLVIVQMVLCVRLLFDPHIGFIHHIGIRTSFGLFSAWLVGRAAFGFRGIVGWILNARPLRYIGKISYAIYLFHPFVPGMLLGLDHPHNIDLRFLMNGVITVALASVSWYFFESRILKYKERFE